MEQKTRIEVALQRRSSSAASPQKDKRTKRLRTRKAQKDRAIEESR